MNIDAPPKIAPTALMALIVLWLIGLLWSGWAPHDRTTWWMEVFPCFIALALLWGSRQSFEFTAMIYALSAIHGLILMLVGAIVALLTLSRWHDRQMARITPAGNDQQVPTPTSA